MPREHTETLPGTLMDALNASAVNMTKMSRSERLPDTWLRILPSDELGSEGVENLNDDDASELNQEREVPEGTQAWRLILGDAGMRYFVVSPIASSRLSTGDAADALMAAVRLRSRLSEEERADLYLLLIAMPGAKEESEWRRAARQMEQNEAFCRIFVWLPGKLPTDWPSEAQAFARRLFLVRLSMAQGSRGDIAPLSALFNALRLSPTARAAWEATLLHDGLSSKDGKAIADRLIDALARSERDGYE